MKVEEENSNEEGSVEERRQRGRERVFKRPIGPSKKWERMKQIQDRSRVSDGALIPFEDDRRSLKVPPSARWTKISRRIVNPEALSLGKERFEARDDFVIVLGLLSREKIQIYAETTYMLRELRRVEHEDDGGVEADENGRQSSIQAHNPIQTLSSEFLDEEVCVQSNAVPSITDTGTNLEETGRDSSFQTHKPIQTILSELLDEEIHVPSTAEASSTDVGIGPEETGLSNCKPHRGENSPEKVFLDDETKSIVQDHRPAVESDYRTNAVTKQSGGGRLPKAILSSEEQTLALQTAPDPVRMKKIWTLNSFERQNDPSFREKFLLYYHELPNKWRQVTISVSYGDVCVGSFESRLLLESSGDVRSAWLYSILRPLLLETNLYPTVTNFEIKSRPDGRLCIWVTEDTEWCVRDYPIGLVSDETAPKVPETQIELDSQISSYLYRVRVQSTALIRQDISGPASSRTEHLLLCLCKLRDSSPHVARLEGVVVDESSSYIKGILLEPLERGLQGFIRPQTAWNRRLKWAHQLAQGVTDTIRSGLVLDNRFGPSSVFIDDGDNARLRITFTHSYVYEPDDKIQDISSSSIIIRCFIPVLELLASPSWNTVSVAPTWFTDIIDRCKQGYHASSQSQAETVQWMMEIVAILSLNIIAEHKPSGDVQTDDCEACSDTGDDIFDTLSVISVETAISSVSGNENLTQSATKEFVDLLYEAVDIHALAQQRLEANGLDLDRLRDGIRRLTKLLSKDLSVELRGTVQKDVGGFFMFASRTIASAVISRSGLSSKMMKGLLPLEEEENVRIPIASQHVDPEPQTNYPDSESEVSDAEGHEEEATIDLSELRNSVAASDAFRTFVRSLESLICPTFESELKNMARVAREKKDKIDPHGILGETLAELLYSQPTDICLSGNFNHSRADSFKDYVETLTHQRWNWWPLYQKTPKLQQGKARLQWKCRCGKMRTADIRKSYAHRILKARKETPITTPGTGSRLSSCHNIDLNNPGANSLGSRALGGSSRQMYPSSSSSLSTPGLDQSQDGSQTSTIITSQNGQRFIHFMVPAGALLLNEIESQHLCDRTVFKQMRERYNQAKGIKRWFTRLEFDRCEWFQFEKYGGRRFAEFQQGRPAKEDVEYYSYPRPIEGEPPISREEWRDRFYGYPLEGDYCQLENPGRECTLDAINKIPQLENRRVSTSGEKKEKFFGIVAREVKSDLMLWFYIGVFSIPGVIFFFLWTLGWGRESLQDAATVLILAWTLLGLLHVVQLL